MLTSSPTNCDDEKVLPSATIKDVARLARVSTATVSYVINGKSFVSPTLKARVLEAVAQLGFAPSRVARGLRTQSTRLVGVVVADITNPFFAELVRRVGSAAQESGYSVLLCEADHDPAKEAAALQLLAAHRVEGVVIAPTGPADVYFKPPISLFPKPIVMVDRVVLDAPFDTVSINNRLAAFEVTQHILSLGHTNIAAIAGWQHLTNTWDRVAGFHDALKQFGLPPEAAQVVYADFRRDRARELCRRLLTQPRRPTALFVSNNEMVIGAMQAITDLGLCCPNDVSLAGIDDFPWAETFAPRLTTSRQPIEALAEEAVRVLHARIRGETGPPEHVVLTSQLIVRNSCISIRNVRPPSEKTRAST